MYSYTVLAEFTNAKFFYGYVINIMLKMLGVVPGANNAGLAYASTPYIRAIR